MGSAFDIGGSYGFGAIDTSGTDEPFHHEWEARVFALNRFFLKRGTYTLDEFRDAIERMQPDEYRRASYYERWFVAIQRLVDEKKVLVDV
ncbi:MAG TPA: hypothetical protein VFN49_02335 [Candidatus Aquilonibacter sp.]|nr:hypothetical protein [Candidatus Aquilonibacter sp.]